MNSTCSSKFSNPNPKSRGASCGGSLTCYDGLPAQLRIAKRGTRPGNKFYGYANWPVSAPIYESEAISCLHDNEVLTKRPKH